jgi:predicted dehydrogenase
VKKVRWGLLGAARIGSVVVHAARQSRFGHFAAVASRSSERAQQFAADHGLEESHGSYEDLLASDGVDAIYIALPAALHAEWTVKALEAGKHVLCEKPFACLAADVAKAFDVAEQTGLVCAEGFMYRHHPQTALACRLVRDGAIGSLKHIRTALTVEIGKNDIRRVRALGGGALLDLGCYCVSAARLFGGKPERVFAEAAGEGSDVDMRMAATMRHQSEVFAQFDIGFDLPRRDELELIGTGGKIVIADPWLCRAPTIELHRQGGKAELPVDPEHRFALDHGEHDVYRIEIDAISAAIAGDAALTFGRADAMDQIRVLEGLLQSSQRSQLVAL